MYGINPLLLLIFLKYRLSEFRPAKAYTPINDAAGCTHDYDADDVDGDDDGNNGDHDQQAGVVDHPQPDHNDDDDDSKSYETYHYQSL